MTSRRSLWWPRVLAVALGVTTAVVVLGTAEVALRYLHPIPPEPGLDEFIAKSRRMLDSGCHSTSPGRPMITVVGESSGMFLGQALHELAVRPDAAFGVRNCSSGAIGFEHLKRQFAQALTEHPDALVIVFGHNYAFQYPISAWDFFVLQLRLQSHLLRALAPRRQAQNSLDGFSGVRPPVGALETFLHEAARAARAQGTRLVVSTVTPNLLLTPRGGCPSSVARRQVLEARMLRARGRLVDARQQLASAVDAATTSQIQFELGLWAAIDGDHATARPALERALELDTQSTRVSDDVNETLRRVAREERLLLRDTARVRADVQPDGITGWETVRDNCHLHAELFTEEALAILDLLGVPTASLRADVRDARQRQVAEHAATVLEGLHSSSSNASSPGCEAPGRLTVALWRLLETGDPSIEGLIETWPDRPPLLTRNARAKWFAITGEAYWMAGRPERARELNARALQLDENLADAWVWKALYDVAEGRTVDARRALDRARQCAGGQEAEVYLDLLR